MTCIVALSREKRVFMGADSLCSFGWSNEATLKRPKVFKKDGILYGHSGSIRVAQVLQYHLDTPKHHPDIDDLEFLVTELVPAMKTAMSDQGMERKKEEVASMGDGSGETFLLGYHGSVYRISDDYSVLLLDRGFDAVGSGQDVAVGAIYALEASGLVAPEETLRIAIQAASKAINSVGGPIVIIEEDHSHA